MAFRRSGVRIPLSPSGLSDIDKKPLARAVFLCYAHDNEIFLVVMGFFGAENFWLVARGEKFYKNLRKILYFFLLDKCQSGYN